MLFIPEQTNPVAKGGGARAPPKLFYDMKVPPQN